MNKLAPYQGLWDRIYHPDLRLVIFDLDGTFYDLKKMQKKMKNLLLRFHLFRPWKAYDLYILWQYRRQRAALGGLEGPKLEETAYRRTARQTFVSQSYIKTLSETWFLERPLPYLPAFAYPGFEALFAHLRSRDIQIAVYSDFPAEQKLRVLGLEPDLAIASSDPHINRLKPDPKGVHYILEHFEIEAHQAVFVGDLVEKDGACAIAANVPFVKVPEAFST